MQAMRQKNILYPNGVSLEEIEEGNASPNKH
jgi:hypothetical protein